MTTGQDVAAMLDWAAAGRPEPAPTAFTSLTPDGQAEFNTAINDLLDVVADRAAAIGRTE